MLLEEQRRRRKLNEELEVRQVIKDAGISFPVVDAELVYRKLDADFRSRFSIGRFRKATGRVNKQFGGRDEV